MKSSHTPTKKRRLDKGNSSPQSKNRSKNQPSPGDSKEFTTERYATCWEEISEIETDSIQPCPIIPDYKKPTTSALPIIMQTPIACFCIDGWHFIEKAKSAGQMKVRCHISHIAQHSNTELAIRKVAIRVLPQGGKCSYAELVRNTYRLYRALKNTSDDLVLFSHGGDRRGASFTSSTENNIRAILAHRLGKSQTTINKYLQHGDRLNDEATETLVNASAPKLFFEAFQVQKQVEVTALKADQKDETAIELEISSKVPIWLKQYKAISTPEKPTSEDPRQSHADQSSADGPDTGQEDSHPNSDQLTQSKCSPSKTGLTILPVQFNLEALLNELRMIGVALIEIADSQSPNIGQSAQALRDLITRLCRLLPPILHAGARANGRKEGQA